MKFGNTLGYRFKKLLHSNTSPREIALGVAIGVFIAITPLYGFHTIMVIAAAFLIRKANKIAILAGTNINTALTFPLITWAGYTIGRHILGYPPLSMDVFRHFSLETILRLYYPLFIGSLILGLALAVIAYFSTLLIANMRKKRSVSPRLVLYAAALIALGLPACQAQETALETITYAISPVGWSQYQDGGTVSVNGSPAHLVTFLTRFTGFSDRERIYSDPATLLPVRVEREVSFLFRKEHIVEEYDSARNRLSITKYISGRKVKTYEFNAIGPFHNAITLPFYLRSVPELAIGWSFTARLPQEFTIKLVSIDRIKVPAGTFSAYHFVSSPNKFHIWISTAPDRTPLKVTGLGGRSLMMKKRQEKG